jgi:hypothetical protein
MVFVPETSELWLYYRQVTTDNVIYLLRSKDGVHWGTRQEVARAPNHMIISQSVVRRAATDWYMWAVNGGYTGCDAPTTTVEMRRSADGIHWGAPQTVTLTQPDLFAWHIDVQWIPSRNEYWALFAAKGDHGCATVGAYLATSSDGITWKTYPAPVLARGEVDDFPHVVYRSTFDYDAPRDEIRFWFSGAKFDGNYYQWKTGFRRSRRADVFDKIARTDFHLQKLPIRLPAMTFVP